MTLSSLYLDIIKDRLYCDGADSAARRSAQSALWIILDAMTKVFAPILAFTCDEIWLQMPHRDGDDGRNVLLNQMSKPYADYALSDTEMAVWETALRVRSDVNGGLETARADKRIGKSLEAHVALFATDEDAKAALDAVKSVDLPEIFIVSNVSTNETAPAEGAVVGQGVNFPGLTIAVTEAKGTKCPRCWMHSESPDEHGLCPRCAAVVAAQKAEENPDPKILIRKRGTAMWYAIVAILILIADQGLKYWVTLNIPLDTGHVTLIPGVLELTNIHNNGAAFSILQHAPHWLFVIFTVVFAAIAVFCLRRNIVHGKVGRWSVVLVLAGAVGNCIDRILSGYVVDMFNFLFMRFAVFNLADIFIVVAGITLCLHVIFYRGDGSEEGEPAPKKARKSRQQHPGAPARAHKLHLPARKQQPAAPKKPAAQPVSPAPAKDDPFAAWDRAPVQAQPVTPAAPSAPKKAPAAPAAPKPVQETPKAAAPAVKPADTAPDDPLLAYLNSTPAAPAEPEVADSDKEKDTAPADSEHYSLDDILAEFSDF